MQGQRRLLSSLLISHHGTSFFFLFRRLCESKATYGLMMEFSSGGGGGGGGGSSSRSRNSCTRSNKYEIIGLVRLVSVRTVWVNLRQVMSSRLVKRERESVCVCVSSSLH